MTTLENRPNTALLVVDVQNGVVEGTPARDSVVANVGSLVEKARREEVPVVWVQHSDGGLAKGSDEWRIVPELRPDDAEPLVEKSYGDSFEDTTLENVLSNLRGGRLGLLRPRTSTSAARPRPVQITRNTSETARGPSDWFTGEVYIDAVAAP